MVERFLFIAFLRESRDGEVVKVLAPHQLVPGSIPALDVLCGLSLLVHVPALRDSLRVLRFSSLHKNQHFQIPIRSGNSGENSHSVESTEIPVIYLFSSIRDMSFPDQNLRASRRSYLFSFFNRLATQ